MNNKNHLLATIGIIFLLIGTSFLVGTFYRSTYNPSASLGFLPNSTSPVLSESYLLPPRTYSVELNLDEYVNYGLDVLLEVPVDVYFLDSKGRELWLSENVIDPVWFAKNVSHTETLSIKIPYRGNYSFLLSNSENLNMSGSLYPTLYGCESDLLLFSLATLIVGLMITVTSRIMFQNKEKRTAVKLEDNEKLSAKEIMLNTSQPKSNLDKSKSGDQLRRLLVWEFEEYFAFPMLEIVVVVVVLTVLTPNVIETLPVFSYVNLLSGIQVVFLFLIFVAGVMFCHSYAGSISKGEVKMILSYPVQRSKLFLSKFVALFSILFAVYAGVFVLQIPLLSLNPFEPLFYASLLLVGLQLFMVCTVATALSVVTKNELLSILASALLLFGIESIASTASLTTFTGRFAIGFSFVRQCFHGSWSSVSTSDLLVSIFVVLSVSILLFVFSYVYFTRKMEID